MGKHSMQIGGKGIRYIMNTCSDQGRNEMFTFHSIPMVHAWKPGILDARGHLWSDFYARLPALLCLSNFDKCSFKYSFHNT